MLGHINHKNTPTAFSASTKENKTGKEKGLLITSTIHPHQTTDTQYFHTEIIKHLTNANTQRHLNICIYIYVYIDAQF